jgi:hypothetical protein
MENMCVRSSEHQSHHISLLRFSLRLEGKGAFQSIEPPHLSFQMIDSVTLRGKGKETFSDFCPPLG